MAENKSEIGVFGKKFMCKAGNTGVKLSVSLNGKWLNIVLFEGWDKQSNQPKKTQKCPNGFFSGSVTVRTGNGYEEREATPKDLKAFAEAILAAQ